MKEETDRLDSIDLRIVRELERDARQSFARLAEKVGLSKSPVQARVKRLERLGVIRGYAARVDHARLGAGHVAFAQVTLSDTRSHALEAFNRAVADIPQIVECHMIAGGFDYLLKIRTRDIGAYRRLLGETLSRLPHVSHSSTFVVMEAVKDD
ncbi:Lrp/AsnC family transcriptional regulator [Oceanicella actignis]|uniref:Lrp/AsnC family transcriptional regulator, leucine-responsive regulatory protein n=1 Tax=Oceanicella actignis TaxID=1189325 RepID=A0A1M7T111_9RHOB|nr:Lrp/AsnC ligand binding domain-containing protein [Oceanicella actignis]TYO88920.1 Lrp/AsnC family leucine-responsive transcriptional regulator [Oceanicella actignis]SET37293.1 transcriptional regulator, AsnC family [Oceanicella actignis]SHN64426.1 Lrp/AsnC family transcriptional regulator, leucine-responsive regulatory protein [Oceanicella actignis]